MNLPYWEKDIWNFIQSQSGIGKQNDASNVLKLCKGLKDMDDAFTYDFTTDENNKLEYIIWAFYDSIWSYEVFGDVVVFYTTYWINHYDRPLEIRVGVDNHRNSSFFGCVLLRDEKISSFTWTLKVIFYLLEVVIIIQFLTSRVELIILYFFIVIRFFWSFVKEKYSQTILTDLALKESHHYRKRDLILVLEEFQHWF